ncbi:hypothetical protein GCM10008983_09740 [Lentibacillus halophilus]|uniref:Uncharacterized protein n=1 Tax=Lentibacillus halophilus TaxID=295065 RepID=A0ABP3J075_9BACI
MFAGGNKAGTMSRDTCAIATPSAPPSRSGYGVYSQTPQPSRPEEALLWNNNDFDKFDR